MDASQSRGPEIIGVTATFSAVSILMVLLRFLSRKLSGAGFWWDDWFIILALAFTLVDNGAFFASVAYGYGGRTTSPAEQAQFLKMIYLNATVGYNPALPTVKVSILLFMLRIFPTKGIRRVIYGTLALDVAWWIALEVPLIVQCSPIRAAWDKSIEDANCIDAVKIYIAQNVGNSAIDILILITPLRSLWNLQMKISKRIMVCALLCVGLVVTVCSIARLITFTKLVDYNLDWTWVDAGLWSIVEPNIAILCACLPALGPLVRLTKGRIFPSTSNDNTYPRDGSSSTCFAKGRDANKGPSQRERVDNWDFHRLEDGQGLHVLSHTANSETVPEMLSPPGRHVRNPHNRDAIALNEIHVMREVEVTQSGQEEPKR